MRIRPTPGRLHPGPVAYSRGCGRLILATGLHAFYIAPFRRPLILNHICTGGLGLFHHGLQIEINTFTGKFGEYIVDSLSQTIAVSPTMIR